MINVILESSYIKKTILGAFIVIVAICTIGVQMGSEIISDEVMYGTVEWSKNGDYQLVNKDGEYIVVARGAEEEIIYTAANENAEFADIEGYIIDETESGKRGVINFLTGEVVFVPSGDDTITANVGKIWAVEHLVEGDGLLSSPVIYVLDENFELALDGRIFNVVKYTDKYLYGQMLVNENYHNKQDVAKYGVFGPHPEIEFAVVNGDGEIVYTTKKYIHGMSGDSVVVQNDDGKYMYIDIYTGEEEVAGNEYN